MQWGADLDYLRSRAAKGLSTPQLDDEPHLCERGRWLYDAWATLLADRPAGLSGPTNVPFSAIDRYAARYDLDQSEFEELREACRRLDATMLKKQQEAAPPPPNPKGTPR